MSGRPSSFGFVMPLLAAAGPSGDWCGFSLPGQKRHHGGRVAAAPLEAAPSRELPVDEEGARAAALARRALGRLRFPLRRAELAELSRVSRAHLAEW